MSLSVTTQWVSQLLINNQSINQSIESIWVRISEWVHTKETVWKSNALFLNASECTKMHQCFQNFEFLGDDKLFEIIMPLSLWLKPWCFRKSWMKIYFSKFQVKKGILKTIILVPENLCTRMHGKAPKFPFFHGKHASRPPLAYSLALLSRSLNTLSCFGPVKMNLGHWKIYFSGPNYIFRATGVNLWVSSTE